MALGVAVTGVNGFRLPIELKSADVATLLSGFGGAALGGIVSWVLAKEAGRETLARDLAQRRAEEKASALSVMLKTQQIANGLHTMRKYLYGCRVEANENRVLDRPMWETTKPIISPTPSRLSYASSEFKPLIAAKRADLIDRCNLLALRYEVDETILNDYSSRREAFHEFVAPYSELSSWEGRITTTVPPELRNQFILKARGLEEIIRSLYAAVTEDALEAASLCQDLSAGFKTYFGEEVYALEMDVKALDV